MPEEDEKFDLSAFDEADEEADAIILEPEKEKTALEQRLFEKEQQEAADLEALEQAAESGDTSQIRIASAPFGVTDDPPEQKDPGEVAAEKIGKVGETVVRQKPKPKKREEKPPEGIEGVYVPSVEEFIAKGQKLTYDTALAEALGEITRMRGELGQKSENQKKLETELTSLIKQLDDATDTSTKRTLRSKIEDQKKAIAVAAQDVAYLRNAIRERSMGSPYSVFNPRGKPYMVKREGIDPLRHVNPLDKYGGTGTIPHGHEEPKTYRRVPGRQFMMEDQPTPQIYIPLMHKKGDFFTSSQAEQWLDIKKDVPSRYDAAVLPNYFTGKSDDKPKALGIQDVNPTEAGGKRPMDNLIDSGPIRLAYGNAVAQMERVNLSQEIDQIKELQRAIEDDIGYTNEELEYQLANKGKVTHKDVTMFIRSATSLGDPKADKFLKAAIWLGSEDGQQWQKLRRAALERGEARAALGTYIDKYEDTLNRRHGVTTDMISGATGLPHPFTYHYQVWGGKEKKWGYGGFGNELSTTYPAGVPGPTHGDVWMQHTLELLTGEPTQWYGSPTFDDGGYRREITEGSRRSQDALKDRNRVWARTYWYTFSDHDPKLAHELRKELYNQQFGQAAAELPTDALYELVP